MDVWEALERSTGKHKPEPAEEDGELRYGPCDDAEAAGEQRVQGSQGGSQGFPKAMIPSARVRDGDGIVCER